MRLDLGFDEHIARADKQYFHCCWLENVPGEAGEMMVRRRTKLSFKEHPVPKSLRGMLSASMKPELREWVGQRLNALTQLQVAALTPKEEL